MSTQLQTIFISNVGDISITLSDTSILKVLYTLLPTTLQTEVVSTQTKDMSVYNISAVKQFFSYLYYKDNYTFIDTSSYNLTNYTSLLQVLKLAILYDVTELKTSVITKLTTLFEIAYTADNTNKPSIFTAIDNTLEVIDATNIKNSIYRNRFHVPKAYLIYNAIQNIISQYTTEQDMLDITDFRNIYSYITPVYVRVTLISTIIIPSSNQSTMNVLDENIINKLKDEYPLLYSELYTVQEGVHKLNTTIDFGNLTIKSMDNYNVSLEVGPIQSDSTRTLTIVLT